MNNNDWIKRGGKRRKKDGKRPKYFTRSKEGRRETRDKKLSLFNQKKTTNGKIICTFPYKS